LHAKTAVDEGVDSKAFIGDRAFSIANALGNFCTAHIQILHNKCKANFRHESACRRSLTRAAGLKGLRFHNLSHQAVTELAEMGLSDQTIMSTAGHVRREMLGHYADVRIMAKRAGPGGAGTPVPKQAPVVSAMAHETVNRPMS
jgi:hypothetical protein